MFPRITNNEKDIFVQLDEPLTSDSCVKLTIELLKYILYQKQQIPFAYDCLTQLQLKVKPNDRNHSSIKAFINSVKCITDQLSSQLMSDRCQIKEIVIVIGATITSPKLCIRIELPLTILNSRTHIEYVHSSRKPLLNLMRSMVESAEFQEAMSVPLGPTNTFLLVHKIDSNSASEFFVPKPQYKLPIHSTTRFRIVLNHNINKLECNCHNTVKIFCEVTNELSNTTKEQQGDDYNEKHLPISFIWYQSKQVIKGFKFLR